MAQTMRMAIAGALIATLVSAFAFLAFPPGLRLKVGGREKGNAEAVAFTLRSPTAQGFRPAGEDDMNWLKSLGLDPVRLAGKLNEARAPFLTLAAQPSFALDLITQESVVYLTSSAIVTGLSWEEEDVIIPLYRSALASADARLQTMMAEAASARRSVERAWNIIAISERILQGGGYSELPPEMKSYASSLGLANFEGLFTRQGDERFRMSTNLTRFESSVMWANYATSFEMGRDISCLAILGFVTAADDQPWQQLSSFYSGLLGPQALDCSALSSAAVSMFGPELNEEELLDSTLLSRFSSIISGKLWSFPFPILFSEHALVESLSGLPKPGGNITDGVSELRASRLSKDSNQNSRAGNMAGIWLDMTLPAPWMAPTDRVARAIAGSYLMLSSSHTVGVNVDLAPGQSLQVESNPGLYSSLDSFLIGAYHYIASSLGASERVSALMLLAHDLLTKLTPDADPASPYVLVDSSWAQEFTLLLRIAGLDPSLSVKVQLEQGLDLVTARLNLLDLGGRTGLAYFVSESIDED